MYFGQSVLFIGLTLNAEEPLTYIRENWLDVPRFLAAGAIVSVFATTIPLAVPASLRGEHTRRLS